MLTRDPISDHLAALLTVATFAGGVVALITGAGAVMVVQYYGGSGAGAIAGLSYGVATFALISVCARVTP